MTGETAHIGSFAAEHLPPAYPQRAPWGTAENLRAWQSEALTRYFETEPKDFLAAATPGAGKTTFALRLATELLRRRTIDRITIVTPTEHLKYQWADAAHKVGLRIDPRFHNGLHRQARSFHGVVVTYAQIAAKPQIHRDLTDSSRTLVILDEVHHGGDALSWGDAIRLAFDRAERRVSLTGTPFRSDTAPIPFVTYLPGPDGVAVSRTDYDYGYGRALADGVVRPVLFMMYAGHMRWMTRTGDEMEARLGQDNTRDITTSAWRAALDPQGQWIPDVLQAANRRLSEVREGIPDAAGLVIASDQDDARAYSKLLEEITGEPVTLVLSDESGGSEKIDEFANDTSRWMVAVRMVSEGVDVPRLAVGVYATSASTPLFFAQAVGRFVRARRRGETATIFVPHVPVLHQLAGEMELQRDHALELRRRDDSEYPEMDLFAQADASASNNDELGDDDEGEYRFIASQANFDSVMYQGEDFGSFAEPGTLEELDFIGLPGLLEPDQISELLKHRHKRQALRGSKRLMDPAQPNMPLHRNLREQRKLLNALVSLWSKESSTPHSVLHAQLRSACGGPAVAQATVAQIQSRITYIRKQLSGARS